MRKKPTTSPAGGGKGSTAVPVARAVGKRFWAEAGLATVAGALAVLTLAVPDWIEAVSGLEPDGGGGALEWGIVVVALLICITAAVVARLEWRRHFPAPA